MLNRLSQLMEDHHVTQRLRRVWGRVVWASTGVARDYWKDGNWGKSEGPLTVPGGDPVTGDAPLASVDDALWHALPGEVSEKMWGDHSVTPGDDYFNERMIKPLGLSKDMSVLDLSSGLGGRLQRTTKEFGVYIDGYEPDPAIAARGMELAITSGKGRHIVITAYDPMTLTVSRNYDCVLARETIYRVANKGEFIERIAACCKPKAQVSFTDYILNPEDRGKQAVVDWLAFEKGANPASLVQMAELWAKCGFTLRVHEDQTEVYKKEVLRGLARFIKFLSSGVKPDAETKRAINKRLTTWVYRLAAMQAGVKFCRFYGLR